MSENLENQAEKEPLQYMRQNRNCSSKKCGVKLLKHSNHAAGKKSNFLKNGQDL
jgi:hypothetical protein